MKIVKETEKAVQVEIMFSAEIAPSRGFTSSMIRDFNRTFATWFPKSVIKDGQVADWFMAKKIEELKDYFNHPYYVSANISFK